MNLVPEHLETDRISLELGPFHAALPAPLKLLLKMDGEWIVSAQIETGFLCRGLERAFELNPWRSSLVYAELLDPEAAFHGGLALCLAVEEISDIAVPPRGQKIRLILAELTRVVVHLKMIARLAQLAGADTMTHYVLRDREKVLDLLELLTGSRFARGYLCFGGVQADMTVGFIERVLEVCEFLQTRLKEYNDLFSFHAAFVSRAANTGVLTQILANRLGVTGPNARASGLAIDGRKTHPYLGYEKIDFETPTGKGEKGALGDSYDRTLLRLREFSQSLEILKQTSSSLTGNEFLDSKAEREFSIPRGEARSQIESPRGLLSCHVVSDGSINPSQILFRTPSESHLSAVPHLLEGESLEDLPLILASMDISVAEVDR